jgi:hypothetical protein
MVVIFFSFILPRSSCRYDPALVTPKGTDNGDFSAIEVPEDYVARFTFSIGPISNCRLVENKTHFFEIDATLSNGPISFAIVPTKGANLCEQFRKFVGHSRLLRGMR